MITPYGLDWTASPLDRDNGIFGWMHWEWERLGVEMYLVFICGFLGLLAYNGALRKVPSTVVSVVMLLEPVGGQICAMVVGIAGLPSWQTMVGGLVLLLGTGLVSMSAQDSAHGLPAAHSKDDTPGDIELGASQPVAVSGSDIKDPSAEAAVLLCPS